MIRSKLNAKVCKHCDREPDIQHSYISWNEDKYGDPVFCDVRNPSWRVFCAECLACARGNIEDEAIVLWNLKMKKTKR